MTASLSDVDRVSGDQELVRQVARGSSAALASLYDRHADGVFRMAASVTRDRGMAEEVVQETFLALWNRAELFDPARGSFGTWLRAIARHRALDGLRAAGRHRRAAPFSTMTIDDPEAPSTVEWLVESGELVAAAGPEPQPEAVVVAREDLAVVASALAGLTAPEREAIVLAYGDGLTQSEIAARLGWPLGTVKTRSRRALRRLREVLVSEGRPELQSARPGSLEPCLAPC